MPAPLGVTAKRVAEEGDKKVAQNQRGGLEDFLTVYRSDWRREGERHRAAFTFSSSPPNKGKKKRNAVSPHDESLEAHKHKSSAGKNPCGLWKSSLIQ